MSSSPPRDAPLRRHPTLEEQGECARRCRAVLARKPASSPASCAAREGRRASGGTAPNGASERQRAACGMATSRARAVQRTSPARLRQVAKRRSRSPGRRRRRLFRSERPIRRRGRPEHRKGAFEMSRALPYSPANWLCHPADAVGDAGFRRIGPRPASPRNAAWARIDDRSP